tara:strand:- start:5468 stop:5911 length:444 start_codon:yes stop_codon:yes gene_type:complete
MLSEEKKRRIKIENYVKHFKSRLSKKYGVHAIIIYNFIPKIKGPLELHELEAICNKFVDKNLYPGGIRNRSRITQIVTYRQLFMYVACKMGYTITYTSNYLNFDHATVIHSRKSISSLLEINDEKVVIAFKKIEDGIEEYIRNKYFV